MVYTDGTFFYLSLKSKSVFFAEYIKIFDNVTRYPNVMQMQAGRRSITALGSKIFRRI